LAAEALQEILASKSIASLLGEEVMMKFNLHEPKLILGDIASGDQFINNNEQRDRIISALPTVVCVEMEGAAVAQVCYENNIPFIIIRTISDVADENSHIDFLSFVKEVSSKYSIEIVRKYTI
jgi:adenosylhomocysteine nucleosidase